MKLDILVIAVHPDDAELACSGTVLKQIEQGYKVGVVDLTRGELGTRGSAELRDQEAKDSAKVLGLHARENLCLADGFFQNSKVEQYAIIRAIRKYRPEIVLGNAIDDRHPDHGRAGKLIFDACFLSGLIKIKTTLEEQEQEAWRPKQLYHYIQDKYTHPDFVVDVTKHWNKKVEAIKAFKSQFFNPENDEPETHISSRDFFQFIEARSREMGHQIGVTHGEGFVKSKQIGVSDIMNLS